MTIVSAAAACCSLHESPRQSCDMPRNWNATPTGHVKTSMTLRMAKTRGLPNLRNGGTCLTTSWYWIKVTVLRAYFVATLLAKKFPGCGRTETGATNH